MKHYKVKTGYGKDDFIVVDENEVPMAIRAQITGKVGVFNEGTVSGNSIMSITPYFNREMGWNRDHQLTDEDYQEIGQEKQQEYRGLLAEISSSAKKLVNPQVRSLADSKRI